MNSLPHILQDIIATSIIFDCAIGSLGPPKVSIGRTSTSSFKVLACGSGNVVSTDGEASSAYIDAFPTQVIPVFCSRHFPTCNLAIVRRQLLLNEFWTNLNTRCSNAQVDLSLTVEVWPRCCGISSGSNHQPYFLEIFRAWYMCINSLSLCTKE